MTKKKTVSLNEGEKKPKPVAVVQDGVTISKGDLQSIFRNLPSDYRLRTPFDDTWHQLKKDRQELLDKLHDNAELKRLTQKMQDTEEKARRHKELYKAERDRLQRLMWARGMKPSVVEQIQRFVDTVVESPTEEYYLADDDE